MVLISQALKKIGCKQDLLNDVIDKAQDGQDALTKVQTLWANSCQQYGLILSDCQMPIMDGYESCKAIRETVGGFGGDQPYIVAVTGNVEEVQIQKAWASKFDEVISKPATVDVVQEVLMQILVLD